MIVVIIDQSLEVSDFDLFVTVLALDKRIKLYHRERTHTSGVVLEKLLDNLIVLELIRGNA